jgi:zinc protease
MRARSLRCTALPVAVAILSLLASTTTLRASDDNAPSRAVLDNGFEIVLHEDHRQPLATVVVEYFVGMKDDPKHLDGLAHLAEHLSFRTSRHVGDFGVFAHAERVGAEIEAYTTLDNTRYITHAPAAALETVLWIESDRMAFVADRLSAEHVQRELTIHRHEWQLRHGSVPGDLFSRLSLGFMLRKEHPYYPGPEVACHDNCRVEHVVWLMQRAYRPENARMIIVGDFDSEQVLKQIRRYFGPIKMLGQVLPPSRGRLVAPPHRQALTVVAPVSRSVLTLSWPLPAKLVGQHALLDVFTGVLESELAGHLVRARGIAASVSVGVMDLELAQQLRIHSVLQPGVSHDQFEHEDDVAAEKRAQVVRLRFQWEDLSERVQLLADTTPRGGTPLGLESRVRAYEKIGALDLKLAFDLVSLKERYALRLRAARGTALRGEIYD